MSSQKSPNTQKMGMSLELTQKPTLQLQCATVCACEECYYKPDIPNCPREVKLKDGEFPAQEKLSVEDLFCY